MKATGIVRRIDDLGRVVIPKEIRRTQRIREGDPLEIFVSGDGDVIFKKYSPLAELAQFAAPYAEVLAKNLGGPVLICDRERVVAAAGPGRRDHAGRRIGRPVETLMDRRRPWQQDPAGQSLYPFEGAARPLLAANPILAGGDVLGAVLLLEGEQLDQAEPSAVRVLGVAAAFLAKQMEE